MSNDRKSLYVTSLASGNRARVVDTATLAISAVPVNNGIYDQAEVDPVGHWVVLFGVQAPESTAMIYTIDTSTNKPVGELVKTFPGQHIAGWDWLCRVRSRWQFGLGFDGLRGHRKHAELFHGRWQPPGACGFLVPQRRFDQRNAGAKRLPHHRVSAVSGGQFRRRYDTLEIEQ